MRFLWTRRATRGRRVRALGALLAVVASCIGGYVAASAVGKPSALDPRARESSAIHDVAVTSATANGVAIKYVEGGKEVAAAKTEGGYIPCPAKYFAIGGGYYGEDPHVTAIASNPLNSAGKPLPPTGWGFTFVNADSAPHPVLEFAVCERGAKYQK